ncbi:MAG TPA: polysaccharide deacetylase family protein [Candidatus Sulfotelmatobacter sp.]|nr:polysaccharide deacetylase family protein [Candidatus Sulfotelmatobacter sp.]
MRDDEVIYLMYHELEVEGRPTCRTGEGYLRYVVRQKRFLEQVRWLRSTATQGRSVTQALEKQDAGQVVMTFDDGCETDLTVAAPILREAGFGATFYITLDFLGQPGYLTERQVRELNEKEFEIGCHSMTHPYLPELSEVEVRREIVEAKHRLEQITGRAVVHFSCPGGGWTRRAAEIAREAGYRSVTTSRVGVNRLDSDRFALARVPIMRNSPLSEFRDLCQGRGLRKKQLRNLLQTTVHGLLGNNLYDHIRSLILEKRS